MHVNFLGPPLHDNKEKLLKYFLMENETQLILIQVIHQGMRNRWFLKLQLSFCQAVQFKKEFKSSPPILD